MKNNLTLKATEYIEDLQFQGLKIILDKNLPAFTTDAVLLSDFAQVKAGDFVADLGTGTGIIPLLMHGRYGMSMIGFELQEELCSMAERSFILCSLSHVLKTECMDFRQAYTKYNSTFSAIVCNPPYFDKKSGLVAPQAERAISRSNISCTIDEVIQAGSRLLKSGGKLFICYPASQLVDLMTAMRNYSIEPKRLRMVRSTPKKSPYLVLIEGRKDGGVGLSYENDLIILDHQGNETPETRRIYHRPNDSTS